MPNKQTPLGFVHIKLPFKSTDDISFSGAYAPFADKLVDTLKEHLSKNTEPEDAEPEAPEEDAPEEPTMDQLRQGLPHA